MRTETTGTGSSAKRKTYPYSVLGLVKSVVGLGVALALLAVMVTAMEEQADLKDKVRALSDARGDGRNVYNYICDDDLRKAFKWKEFVDPQTGDRSVVYMGPCKAP